MSKLYKVGFVLKDRLQAKRAEYIYTHWLTLKDEITPRAYTLIDARSKIDAENTKESPYFWLCEPYDN